MEKHTVINGALLAGVALNLSHAFGKAPSSDERYVELRHIMREYIEKIAAEECTSIEGFSQNTYDWNDYEITGLQVVLLDLVNHTKNFCKPPEPKGMHSAAGKSDDN